MYRYELTVSGCTKERFRTIFDDFWYDWCDGELMYFLYLEEDIRTIVPFRTAPTCRVYLSSEVSLWLGFFVAFAKRYGFDFNDIDFIDVSHMVKSL